ncbi:MAG: hypothetical protein LBQ52_04730 [Helicobacteraceae bacterium]|jgi:hypothetical protein|nr:hypothetical protein [Helicobacteraceae bacterium]
MATKQELLDAIDATIEGRITDDISAYTLPNGQSVTKTPIADLLKLRAQLRREIAEAELLAAKADGKASGRKIKAYF